MKMASKFGTSGQMIKVIWDPFTDSSGETGITKGLTKLKAL